MLRAATHRTPIYRDSGFLFHDITEAELTFRQERQHPVRAESFVYTRYGNPTVCAAEQQLAQLEGSRWAALTSSGMSAIDTALSIFQKGEKTGTWLFFSELYGGTNAYIENILKATRGISIDYFNPSEDSYDFQEFCEKLDTIKPSLIFMESVSNPLLIVPDAQKMLCAARERGIKTIVDNTFGTPFLWQPLEDNADIVVHSATKYISGHGNITAGLLCGNDDTIHDAVLDYRKFTGCILSPDDAYRLQTQACTFKLRFAKQCDNAYKIAKLLAQSKSVSRVLYPGLESHKTFNNANVLFKGKGFGGMVTFELTGGRAMCDAFVTQVHDHIRYIPTLGDINSILLHPHTVFGAKYPESMIRLSVGCEDYPYLQQLLESSLG